MFWIEVVAFYVFASFALSGLVVFAIYMLDL